MRELRGDLFRQAADAICLTTNGAVNRSGAAVMGRGCALEASRRWPILPSLLGAALRREGTRLVLLTTAGPDERPALGATILPYHLVAFPVKPAAVVSTGHNVVRRLRHRFPPGAQVPGWAAVADLDLIRTSCRQLAALATEMGWSRVVLPRPGCGAGERDWGREVRPVVAAELDDRFSVITW